MMCVVYVFILNVAIKVFYMEFGERERSRGWGEVACKTIFTFLLLFQSPGGCD